MRPTLLFFLFALAHLGCHLGRSTTTDSVSPDAVEIESSCIATFEGSIERSPALTPEDEIIVAIEPFDGKGLQLARVSIDGARIWQVEVTALGWRLASPPVVRIDGEILLTVVKDGEAGQLLRIAADSGAIVQRIALERGPTYAPTPLPPGPILVPSGKKLLALSRDGQLLFSRDYEAEVTSDVVVGATAQPYEVLGEGENAKKSYLALSNYQRLAAFGLADGTLAWLTLRWDRTRPSELGVDEEKLLSLADPLTRDKIPYHVKQPGAFDANNTLLVVMEGNSFQFITPSGEALWGGRWANTDYFSGAPVVIEADLYVFVLGREEGTPLEVSYFTCGTWPDTRAGGCMVSSGGLGQAPTPTSAVVTRGGNTFLSQRHLFVERTRFHWIALVGARTKQIGTINGHVSVDVQTPPVLHPQGYLVAGATDGCLARITLPADEPRPAYLSTAWPRYRYDNRNSGVRWTPYGFNCGDKIWDCPY